MVVSKKEGESQWQPKEEPQREPLKEPLQKEEPQNVKPQSVNLQNAKRQNVKQRESPQVLPSGLNFEHLFEVHKQIALGLIFFRTLILHDKKYIN